MSGCQNHSIRQQEKLSGGYIIVKPCTAVVTNTRKLVKFMKWLICFASSTSCTWNIVNLNFNNFNEK